jgi:hypothetical protein
VKSILYYLLIAGSLAAAAACAVLFARIVLTLVRGKD